MATRPLKMDKDTVYWWWPSLSWRHNVAARELSANHMLRCTTMQVHGTSQPILRGDASVVWQWKQYGRWRLKFRAVSSASKTFGKYTRSKTIHWQSYHHYINGGPKETVGKILREKCPFLLKIQSPTMHLTLKVDDFLNDNISDWLTQITELQNRTV